MISPKALIASYLDQQGYASLFSLLEYPTDPAMGDVALPCFQFSKERKQSPVQIASDIIKSFHPHEFIADIQAVGPYINFFMNWNVLSKEVFRSIGQQDFGKGQQKHKTILIESPGPNTNKPLHLGHVRNMLLGNSLAKILDFSGYDVKKVDIINDRGVHICKSMLAFQKSELRDCRPENVGRKSDHFVGDCYVAYDKGLKEHPEWETEIQEMLVKREQNDPETRALRQQMNKRCLEGHAETYKRYGTHIDKAYFESDHYLKGKELVEQGIKDALFYANDKGNIVADLTVEMGQEKTVLRADGTSIYITQDLALGKLRYEDFCMDSMIYVVGNEQEDHFKALFYLFKKLGYSFADACYHLSYGMIELPDGKMKSREGNVVDADSLADEMHERVVALLIERYPDITTSELHRRAEIIAMAAIKFFILKYDAKKNFVFDREHSLDFAGETGPYVLYSYARCRSILEKQETKNKKRDFDIKDYILVPDERILLSLLAKFPEIVAQSAKEYAPALIARYLLTLSAQRNSYYHHTKILNNELHDTVRDFRLSLVASISEVIKIGLGLLGIEVLEKM